MFGPQHFLFPFLAHALGTLLGATVAYLIAVQRRDVMAYVIGALFLAGGIYSVFALPAPTWFSVVDVLFAYLPMAWLGILLGKRLSGGSSP